MSEENCDSCKFCVEVDGLWACRRYAPRPSSVIYKNEESEPIALSYWPLVKAVDWCGEYVPKDVVSETRKDGQPF